MYPQTTCRIRRSKGGKLSNSDSFIDEVAEEVRRDKLYLYIRRYGWIAVLLVLLIVGGATFNEYRNGQTRAAAEATGDALLNALNQDDIPARAEIIAQIDTNGPAAAITSLLTAAMQEEAGDYAGAAETLGAMVTDGDIPDMYRDLATFKAAMLPSEDTVSRMATLEQLSQPGQPFRLLALEQLSYAQLEAKDTDAALATMRQVVEDASVSRGLQDRVQTLMIALGEPIPGSETE